MEEFGDGVGPDTTGGRWRGAAFLECSSTGVQLESEMLHGLSPAGRPLLVRYDLDAIREGFQPTLLPGHASDLWRYAEVLPLRDPACVVSLGEGWTPLIESASLARRHGLARVLVKDEAQNPTASFKARGMSLAVSRALELGVSQLAVPSAGNAGGAAAAYGAAAGLPVHVVVPRDTPAPIVEEIRALGADLTLIEGSIMDCGALVRRGVHEHGWWDLSTLREPYRIEGKKTMAYELFEQLGGRLPDAIVFPTGGGTGLIGMWKAFEEMAALGWTGKARPRMFAVQATGCAPLVRAWEKGADHFSKWEAPRTYASGIRVPAAVGDFLMLRVLRESNGGAVAVSDAEMESGVELLGSETGVFAAPEGGAAVAALAHFSASGAIGPKDEVVVFNTGSGLKYVGAHPGS